MEWAVHPLARESEQPIAPEVLDALGDHGVRHLAEAGDIGAHDEIAGLAEFLRGFGSVFVDIVHDAVELLIHRGKIPALHARILGHFRLAGASASARLSSFCVAQGKAAKQGTFHTALRPLG